MIIKYSPNAIFFDERGLAYRGRELVLKIDKAELSDGHHRAARPGVQELLELILRVCKIDPASGFDVEKVV